MKIYANKNSYIAKETLFKIAKSWMDGWMDGWMDKQNVIYPYNILFGNKKNYIDACHMY